MKKCVKISCSVGSTDRFLHELVVVQARALGLEGVAQAEDERQAKITIFGPDEAIETFIDFLHRESETQKITDLEIEPALKERDYRGVFRIIE